MMRDPWNQGYLLFLIATFIAYLLYLLSHLPGSHG